MFFFYAVMILCSTSERPLVLDLVFSSPSQVVSSALPALLVVRHLVAEELPAHGVPWQQSWAVIHEDFDHPHVVQRIYNDFGYTWILEKQQSWLTMFLTHDVQIILDFFWDS